MRFFLKRKGSGCKGVGAQYRNSVGIALQLVCKPATVFKAHAKMGHDTAAVPNVGVRRSIGKIVPRRRMRREATFNDRIPTLLPLILLLHAGSRDNNYTEENKSSL